MMSEQAPVQITHKNECIEARIRCTHNYMYVYTHMHRQLHDTRNIHGHTLALSTIVIV